MSEFLVNATTNYSQIDPQVAIAANGSFVVTWTQYQGGDAYDIYAQRYDSSGVKVGSEFLVNTNTVSSQIIPSISMNASGDFIISWSSLQNAANSYDIIAKRFNANGGAVGSEFIVNTYKTDSQLNSRIAMKNDGSFVAVWQSYGQDGDGNGVYAQRYDNMGAKISSEFRVNVYTGVENSSISGEHQDNPRIAMRNDGSFVVTWTGTMNVNVNYNSSDIFARIYNADGSPSGTEFVVNSYTQNAQMKSDIAADANGNFVITWTSGNLNSNGVWIPAQDGSQSSVYAQRYNANGTKVGSEFRVNTYSTGSQREAKVAMAPTGDFIVTWSSENQDGSGYGVYAQRYTANGVKYGSEFRINDQVSSDQKLPAIAMNGLSDFVVTWQSNGQAGDQQGVYAKRQFTGMDITAASAEKSEGNANTTAFTFMVTRVGDVSESSSANYVVNGGSANAADFGGVLPSGQITFAAGETSKMLTIAVTGDTIVETDETFTVTLSNVVGAVLTKSQAVGTILNDDISDTTYIYGTNSDDVLNGSIQKDNINGYGGNDTLRGLAGDDTLNGGDGIDTADYSLATGPVVVSLRAGTASGNGNDLLIGIENLFGSSFDDILAGDAAANLLDGGGGVDTVSYAQSTQAVSVNLDTGVNTGGDAEGDVLLGIANVIGSSYADTLTGDNDSNLLDGGDGADNLNGNGGADTLLGGYGNDTLSGGTSADLLDGGAGSNTASYALSNASVAVSLSTGVGSGGHAQGDHLTNIQNLIGSSFADTLIGDSQANLLMGGAGADLLIGGAGADSLDGGANIDTISYDASLQGVFLSLYSGAATGGDAEGDVLTGIENLVGSAFADVLAGSSSANLLMAGAGDDVLSGNGGADTLIGGLGNDTLTGGAGADSFRFTTATDGQDVITDFSAETDVVELTASGFGGLALGQLDASLFAFNTATDSNQRFVFNDTSYTLSYDADGSGSGGASTIAVFNNGSLTAANIVII